MIPSQQMVLNLLPEIVLIAIATWMFIGAAFARRDTNWTLTALLGLVVSGVMLGFINWQGMSDAQLTGAVPPNASGPVASDMLGLGAERAS